MDFQVLQCLPDILAASGMWDAVPGSHYRLWRASVEHLWTNRGLAGLRSNLTDDAIIDLVDNRVSRKALGAGGRQSTRPPELVRPVSLVPAIVPAASWLDYQVRLRTMRSENVSVHRLSKQITSGSLSQSSSAGLGTPYQTSDGKSGCVRETHGEPIQEVVLEGMALRLKYRPSVPVLKSVGGRPVKERRRDEERRVVSHFCGVPVFLLRWDILYDVAGYIGPHEPPNNPVMPRTSQVSSQ